MALLEEQLREKWELVRLPRLGEAQRAEKERQDLEGIRACLLRAKEACAEGDGDGRELERAQLRFLAFKRRQLAALTTLEKELVQQKELLKKEVEEEREILERLKSGSKEESRLLFKKDGGAADVPHAAGDAEQIDLYRDTSSHLLRAGTRGTCGTVGARLPCSSIHRKAAVSEALTPGHALEAPGVSPEAHSFPEEA